jgi:hypothetical protein
VLKRLRHEYDYPSPSSTEVTNEWSYIFNPHTPLWYRRGKLYESVHGFVYIYSLFSS